MRNDLRRLCLHLLLAWSCCGIPALALAQSHVDDPDEDSTWWALSICMAAGGIGFVLGAKIKITRDIVSAAS